MRELIAKSRRDNTSLAVFKPTQVLNFRTNKTDREWDPDKLAILTNLSKQMSLIQTPEEIVEEFKLVPKVPYDFSYVFCG